MRNYHQALNVIHPRDRAELRQWFFDHACDETSDKRDTAEVFVHCTRKKHDSIISYLDVVEEALCFGWIDSTTRSYPDGNGYLQRLSPRRKNSNWTELNKERCRRLIKLGLMTPAGRLVLPSLDEDSFTIDPWIMDAIQADKLAWMHHEMFHPLYVRVRMYNIQWCMKHVSKERALAMLQKYVKAAHEGRMIGEWNDNGRLLDY